MHNLFLGEFKYHCMQVFGIDTAGEKTVNKNMIAHTPSQQQLQLDRIRKAIMASSHSALVKIRRDYLAAVAEFNDIVAPGAKHTKGEYAEALLKWDASRLRLPPVMHENTTHFQLLQADGGSRDSERFRSVFTGDVLQQVRDDIAKTTLPSWVEAPPRNLGSPSHGKLKADHWRTVGTVSLVITLVRLWGARSASPEEQAVLENFVALSSAVDLATRRSMSPSRAASFDHHMEAYVRGLRTLFDISLVPNHHLSLHLKQCLELFGPVHGWWAFPFERYNGMLQRLNTNSKPAEMPLTFMRYFYMGATLRWMMSTIDWPDVGVYAEMLKAFDTAFSDTLRGTRVTDVLNAATLCQPAFSYDDAKETTLPNSLYHAVLTLVNSLPATLSSTQFRSARSRRDKDLPRLPTNAQFVQRLTHNGVSFATRHSSARNSFVLFRTTQNQRAHVAAGQVSQIFYHRRLEDGRITTEPFVVVDEYVPLNGSDEDADPYRRFGDLNTKLYYNTFKASPCVLRLGDIISHFAAFTYVPDEIKRECIVARSLDRVRVLLFS
ncbi:hypothetical protein BV20DRAFT_1035911 [Pilatotrama ljubarskyi]|nr:hypothetical protein BV20DRAFT_1035911 [Pilatotrama ljubarskyi]